MQSRRSRITGKSPADLIGIILIVFILGVVFFRSDSYSVGSDSREAYWVKKTWWGLKEDRREMKWFDASWHTKDKNGEWYICLADDDLPPAEYPHTR